MTGATVATAIPPIVGNLLAAMRGVSKGALCITLPRRGDAPAILALLYSICGFRESLPAKIANLGKSKFAKGELVAIAPTGHVFEYGGLSEDSRSFILKIIGESGLLQLPLNAALRLSRTASVHPKGKLGTPLRSPPRTGLDRLVGAQTFDNPALFSLQIIFIGNRTRFESIVGSLWFTTSGDASGNERVDRLLPLGRLRESPSTHEVTMESSLGTGVPLLASTSNAEKAARFLAANPALKPLILVDGASACRDQQAWDALADMGRVVVIADESEHEDIALLSSRSCPIWKMPLALLAGSVARTDTPLHQLSRWAEIRSQLAIHIATVGATPLDEAAAKLRTLDSLIRQEPESKPAKVAVRIWGLLNRTARSIGPASLDERKPLEELIGSIGRDLNQAALWTGGEEMASLIFSFETAKALLLNSSGFGSAKAQLVLSSIRESKQPALLACDSLHQTSLASWLRAIGLEGVSVHTVGTLNDTTAASNLICPAWPRSTRLAAAAQMLCAPNINLICHPFEAIWAQGARRRILNPTTISTSISSAAISSILSNGAGRALPALKDEEPATIRSASDTYAWDFEKALGAVRKGTGASVAPEEAVQARYVGFHGDGYAYLTTGHKVPVANVLRGAASKESSIPERTVEDIRPDDLLIFTESGAKSVLMEMADRRLGGEAKRLRTTARLWRDAIQKWGKGPVEFEAKARAAGCTRHSVTIRHWCEESLQIGPSRREDLEVIAKVTESGSLISSINEVWTAILQLRAEHLSAGSRLQDDIVAGIARTGAKVTDEGSRVEIAGLGAVWIVRVDHVSEETESRSRNEINRLLRDQRSF